MLTIRQNQHDSLQEEALSSYRRELLEHYQEFAPELYRVAGEEQFCAFIDYGMEKALRIGLSLRGPMRLLLDIMCMLGQDFEVDPQYRPMWPQGDPAELPMPFAQRLRAALVEYLNQCVGAEDKAILAGALRRVSTMSLDSRAPFRNWAREHLKEIYPEKLAYMGERNFSDLLDACEVTAADARIKHHSGQQLIVVLASSFGVNFVSNPLYPWVAKRLLTDAPEETRVEKTQSALRIYASEMLANLQKGI